MYRKMDKRWNMMNIARILTVCLLAVVLLTNCVYADSVYLAGLNCEEPESYIGNSVSVSVDVSRASETVFSSGELKISYDSSKLSFESVSGKGGSANVDSHISGKLIIEDCGADKPLGNSVYVIKFTAIALGEAKVTLDEAAFGTKERAANSDLLPATVEPSSVTISIGTGHTVDLPDEDYVDGPKAVGDGQDYTFQVSEYDHYDYVVTATMGGTDVQVNDDGNGSFTVKNVKGALVFKVSRTPKKYKVIFQSRSGVKLPADTVATYGQDFRFTVPDYDGYWITISVEYEDGSAVPYSLKNGTVVISGERITGNIKISLEQTKNPDTSGSSPTVTEPGSTGSSTESPLTGDVAYTLLWFSLLEMSICVLSICLKRRKIK